jgi:hypothetical protein
VLLRIAGSRRVWLASHVLMAIGVLAPVISPGLAGLIVAALFVGGTFIVSVMGAFGQAREAAGECAGTLIAAMTASYAVGQLVGPMLVSVLVDHGGTLSMGLVASAAVLGASVWGIARGPAAGHLPLHGETR